MGSCGIERCYVKLRQSANDTWQQTVEGHTTGPPSRTRDHRHEPNSVRDRAQQFDLSRWWWWTFLFALGRADEVLRRSKRSFHGYLTGRDWGVWTTSGEDSRLVPHARLSQVTLPFGCMRGKCSHASRFYHQRPETTWKQNMDRLWSVSIVWFLLEPTTWTRRNLQHRRSHSRTLCLRSCSFRWLETDRSRHHHGTQRTHRKKSRSADLFTAAAVPGRSAALDVCVAFPKAAARGGAAQAACDRKLFNYRHEIPDLRNQDIVDRPPRHSNFAACSGHRVQPQRTTNVGKTTLTQMETRNSDSPPPSESSDDASSPAEPLGTSRVAPRRSHRQSSQSLGSCPPSWRRKRRWRWRRHRDRHYHTGRWWWRRHRLFEDNGVCWGVIADMLSPERTVYQRCTPRQFPLTDKQRTNRQKWTGFLTDLVATSALPSDIWGCTLQLLGLGSYVVRKRWQRHRHVRHPPLDNCRLHVIKLDPGCVHLSRHPRALTDLLVTIAELLIRSQPRYVPTLHTAWTIQQVTREEFHILEVLTYELATPTSAVWVKIFGRRLSRREEQQLSLSQHPNIPAASPTVLIDCAHLTAETHVQTHPFDASSMTSQIGASAWLSPLPSGLLEYYSGTLTDLLAYHCSIFRESSQLFALRSFNYVVHSLHTFGCVPDTFSSPLCF